jgi:hypothetical protein
MSNGADPSNHVQAIMNVVSMTAIASFWSGFLHAAATIIPLIWAALMISENQTFRCLCRRLGRQTIPIPKEEKK